MLQRLPLICLWWRAVVRIAWNDVTRVQRAQGTQVVAITVTATPRPWGPAPNHANIPETNQN